MDIYTSLQSINWVAIFMGTSSGFIIGGLWYGPFFGKLWMMEMNLTAGDLSKRNMPKVFGFSILLLLIASSNLALFIGPEGTLIYGTLAGFFAGFGWVSTFIGVLYLFGNRSFRLFLIDAGYCTLTLTIIGSILGAF